MRKSILFFIVFFNITSLFAQKMFQSTDELGVKNHVPSAELKQKVSKISGKDVAPEQGEYYDMVLDKDFYQLKNGYISFYPDNF